MMNTVYKVLSFLLSFAITFFGVFFLRILGTPRHAWRTGLTAGHLAICDTCRGKMKVEAQRRAMRREREREEV